MMQFLPWPQTVNSQRSMGKYSREIIAKKKVAWQRIHWANFQSVAICFDTWLEAVLGEVPWSFEDLDAIGCCLVQLWAIWDLLCNVSKNHDHKCFLFYRFPIRFLARWMFWHPVNAHFLEKINYFLHILLYKYCFLDPTPWKNFIAQFSNPE